MSKNEIIKIGSTERNMPFGWSYFYEKERNRTFVLCCLLDIGESRMDLNRAGTGKAKAENKRCQSERDNK